jgi:hypothetical protein
MISDRFSLALVLGILNKKGILSNKELSDITNYATAMTYTGIPNTQALKELLDLVERAS